MNCRLHWNALSLPDWEERFFQIPRSTLLQSYAYGQFMAHEKQQTPLRGLIEINGQEAGLLQILESKYFQGLVHSWTLDRGPLWFKGFGSAKNVRQFLQALRENFPKRPGRIRRFIPEWPDTPEIRDILHQAGFKTRKNTLYETIWLDLDKEEQDLRAGLRKKWRNALARAERAGLELDWELPEPFLPLFMKQYQVDKMRRGYSGPPAKLLEKLAGHFAGYGQLILGRASLDKRAVSAVMILLHGRGATYQAGWTLPEGRAVNAHNLLLWQACSVLKQKGIKDFDLGGINSETDGIRKFKEGMGGEPVRLCGLYS